MNPDEVRSQWADRVGEFSPEYYAYRGADARSEAVRTALERRVDDDARILEVGCSAGRHLAHLHEHGFDRLTGVEINEDARSVMAETYPELYADADLHFASLQSVLPELEADSFDAAYAVETLQHVPPEDEWVFAELARVVGDVLVTVEIETPAADAEPENDRVNYVDDGVPLYYRDWETVFGDLRTEGGAAFEQVAQRSLDRDALRVFRRADDEPGRAE